MTPSKSFYAQNFTTQTSSQFKLRSTTFINLTPLLRDTLPAEGCYKLKQNQTTPLLKLSRLHMRNLYKHSTSTNIFNKNSTCDTAKPTRTLPTTMAQVCNRFVDIVADKLIGHD